MLRAVRFLLGRLFGDRVLRLTTLSLFTFFLLIYLFQLIVSLGLDGEDNFTDTVAGYVQSFGGRTAYVLSAIVCALAAARLLSFSQNVILFAQGTSAAKIWVANIISALVLSAVVALFYILLQFAVLALFVQFNGLPSSELNYFGYGLRSFVVLFLWGLIGFGLSYILRNQAVTIVFLLVFGFILEPIVTAILNESDSFSSWVAYLPGSLNWALSWPADEGATQGATTSTNACQSALGLTMYAVTGWLAAFVISFRSGGNLLKR